MFQTIEKLQLINSKSIANNEDTVKD
jgi:hypothetical protein